MKLRCEHGCLTCAHASIVNKHYIDCNVQMPKLFPACLRYTRPTIRFEFGEGYNEIPDSARAYVCHDEFYDEVFVINCPAWMKRPRDFSLKQISPTCHAKEKE